MPLTSPGVLLGDGVCRSVLRAQATSLSASRGGGVALQETGCFCALSVPTLLFKFNHSK